MYNPCFKAGVMCILEVSYSNSWLLSNVAAFLFFSRSLSVRATILFLFGFFLPIFSGCLVALPRKKFYRRSGVELPWLANCQASNSRIKAAIYLDERASWNNAEKAQNRDVWSIEIRRVRWDYFGLIITNCYNTNTKVLDIVYRGYCLSRISVMFRRRLWNKYLKAILDGFSLHFMSLFRILKAIYVINVWRP